MYTAYILKNISLEVVFFSSRGAKSHSSRWHRIKFIRRAKHLEELIYAFETGGLRRIPYTYKTRDLKWTDISTDMPMKHKFIWNQIHYMKPTHGETTRTVIFSGFEFHRTIPSHGSDTLIFIIAASRHDFTSMSCRAYGAEQGSAHRWRRCGRRVYRAWGPKHHWRMHVDIECGRLHAWSRVVEEYFWQTFIQTRPAAGVIPQYFKARAAWKSPTTRISERFTGTGVGDLRARESAGCLPFRPRMQRWGWRVLIEWHHRSDRG